MHNTQFLAIMEGGRKKGFDPFDRGRGVAIETLDTVLKGVGG